MRSLPVKAHKALRGICPEFHNFTHRWQCLTAQPRCYHRNRAVREGGSQEVHVLVPRDSSLWACPCQWSIWKTTAVRHVEGAVVAMVTCDHAAFLHTFYSSLPSTGPRGGCLRSTWARGALMAALVPPELRPSVRPPPPEQANHVTTQMNRKPAGRAKVKEFISGHGGRLLKTPQCNSGQHGYSGGYLK